MKRRNFLAAAGAATTAVAGCLSLGDTTDAGNDALVVGTYSAFIDSPSSSPGAWLKSEFESEFDTNLVWQTPSNELNHYVQRKQAGVDIEADVYLGLNTDDLVRVDRELDDSLFTEAGDIDGQSDVKSELQFDPQDRAVPFDTGYISLVYDGTAMTAPETFDGLLTDDVAGDLITQNPGGSATGKSFLLHTIKQYGSDGYLDYWSELQANGVQVLGSWSDAYGAWSNGEAPMVVSYSTDQVFADQSGESLDEHQVRFLNDQGYANPEGMAVFEGSNQSEIAREFMSFVLRPEVQGEIAVQNVQFPATETADVPSDYAELAKEPPEPVTFTYEELQGQVSGWVEDWERQFAGN
ncbi:thiamine ABC transporter substrate-binding protein [Halorientalis sp.]|jgi:thiamine transport system substrate-binding protein|uniref:thiamine ABC transporter substrate-binding protein n=1 Tax=Halorientalis sp. TaxID=1931229 RepID=UPI002623F4C4|nr:thiamine ABC transporter substrate-binding protein [Halorientalis sp.]